MIKIPYGISNFELLVNEGQYYVDRTNYIEELENYFSRYLFFVRPRRFGKSLFVSTLEHYYGIEHKDKFDKLFGQYYIGKNPTKNANQYLVLKFDFSRINTSSFENTYQSFLENVKKGVIHFFDKYSQFFNQKDIDEIQKYTFPADVLQYVFLRAKFHANNHKIYLLIDEYDHFANEILSFRFDDFSKIISQNGFVRKFYESIKVGTHEGVVDRFFVTGVSPITLDSLTSGFNISTNISLVKRFHGLMGFTEEEVHTLIRKIGIPNNKIDITLTNLRNWYNGYLFNTKSTVRLYNSDMVLYFASQYIENQEYPEELLDPNIVSDYTKIRRLFSIKEKEQDHIVYLEDLLKEGEVNANLVRQFELSSRFNRDDFISLLYYTGILTIDRSDFLGIIFKMPNYVIRQLYYQYFHQILLEKVQFPNNTSYINPILTALAVKNNINPLINYTQSILQELSTRDKMKFDEKHIKIIFTSAFFRVGVYTIFNEFEVKKSPSEKGYVDILLLKRPPFKTKYQFVIELKYLKKGEAKKAEQVKKDAVIQLKSYLENDDYLQELEDLKAYVVLFVGNEGSVVEVDVK